MIRWREIFQRALAVTILLGLVLVAYNVIVSPLLHARAAADQRIAGLARQASTYTALVEERARWEALKHEATEAASANPLLTAGEDRSQTHATAMTAASGLAAQNGLEVRSTETGKQSASDGLVEYPVTLRLSGSDRSMIRFMKAVEASRPVLLLERLNLRMEDGSLSPEGDPILTAEVDLVALGRERP